MSSLRLKIFYLLLLGFAVLRVLATWNSPIFPAAEESSTNGLTKLSNQIRSEIVKKNQLILNEPAAGLVNGIVWGEKASLLPQHKKEINRVGLSHVVVASGMNLVLLVGFVHLLLPGKGRRKTYFIGSVICLYILITGFQPPIMRAGLMLGFVLVANLLGRPTPWFWPLLAIASIMILIDPQLSISISFQLSVLAMAGQIVLGRLGGQVSLIKKPITGEIAQTLAAQIFTLPVILANFGNYSFVSILANALALWVVPWIMGLGFVAGIAAWIFEPLGKVLSLPLVPLTTYFWLVVKFFGNLNIGLLDLRLTDPVFPIGYYLILTGLVLWLLRRLPKQNYDSFKKQY